MGRWSRIASEFRPLIFWALWLCAVPASARTVAFKTVDSVRIKADYTPPKAGRPVLILLHGLGAGRGEWREFISTLSARGFGSLALDARGHGASGGPSFRTFRTPEAWMVIERDLAAAIDYLEMRKISRERIILAGASIGANLVLRAAVKADSVPGVVLLSAGFDYRGVRIEEALKSFRRPVIAAAAPNDPYAYRTFQWMRSRLRNSRSRALEAAFGHGAQMLSGEANGPFVAELLESLETLVRKPAAFSGGTSDTPSSP